MSRRSLFIAASGALDGTGEFAPGASVQVQSTRSTAAQVHTILNIEPPIRVGWLLIGDKPKLGYTERLLYLRKSAISKGLGIAIR